MKIDSMLETWEAEADIDAVEEVAAKYADIVRAECELARLKREISALKADVVHFTSVKIHRLNCSINWSHLFKEASEDNKKNAIAWSYVAKAWLPQDLYEAIEPFDTETFGLSRQRLVFVYRFRKNGWKIQVSLPNADEYSKISSGYLSDKYCDEVISSYELGKVSVTVSEGNDSYWVEIAKGYHPKNVKKQVLDWWYCKNGANGKESK